MVDTYTIYLENQSTDPQTFWCFLAAPEEVANDPGVYANSSASLTVLPNMPGNNSFAIPVQYIVGAGASNHAVGLNVQINSNVTNMASIEDTWDANYVTLPPQEGPTMALASPKAPANAIAIVSNAFDKGSNEVAGWFASQTFGIETEAGFVGMTWSPDPQKTRTLTPKLTFYVATGDYGSNELASWDDVSNGSAAVSVPNNFVLNACTVTYTATGGWTITAGAPASVSMTEDLSWFRSPAHEELVALAYLDNSTVGTDTLQAVNWDRAADDLGGGNTYLSGTVTVTTALAAAFTYFVISGVRFTIDKPAGGATSFRFSYSGSKSADAVKSLFVAGATMLMGGSK